MSTLQSVSLVTALAVTGGATLAAPSDTHCAVEDQKLLDSDPHVDGYFGAAVASDGDTIVAGNWGDDELGNRAGAVHVFVLSGGAWVEEAKLLAPDGAAEDRFGVDVAIQGDRLAIGTVTDPGAVYLFERSAGVWSFQDKLEPRDGQAGDRFGTSVSLSGDQLLVGANGAAGLGPDTGAAYVFRDTGSAWVQEARLSASDGALNDRFGADVALDGDVAVCGAFFVDGVSLDAGAAYVYRRTGTSWSEEAKLEPTDAVGQNLFGDAVAVSGDTIACGSPFHWPDGIVQAGAAYVYRHSGTSWTLEQKLVAEDAFNNDELGSALALEGDRLLAGATRVFYGKAYVFERAGTTWSQAVKLAPSDRGGGGEDRFGGAVVLDGDRAVVGSPFDRAPSTNSGSAFVFTILPVPGTAFCFGDGTGTACPCGNDSPVAERGCATSVGVGIRIEGCGTTSIAADDLRMIASELPWGNSGLFYAGTHDLGSGSALFDGLQCVGGFSRRFQPMFQTTGQATDTGFVAQDPSGTFFVPGGTFHFQYWTRDVSNGWSPCGSFRNFSPGYAVTMTP